MLFALLHKKNIVGLFDDYESCTNMLEGLVNNEFTLREKLEIVAYENNSIKRVKSVDVCEYSESEDDNTTPLTTEEEPVFISKEEKEKMKRREERQKKREYNLSVLKKKKEKLNEQRRVFKVDIELYEKFKNIKASNENFEIPEMFEKKYIIMEELEKQNSLDCDTFYQVYEDENIGSSWSGLFSGKSKEPELLEITESSEDEQ